MHTRRSDHRSLILAFFVVLPLQYVIVGARRFDLFTVFIPVYVFFALPVVSALAGDPQRFLERNAKIQWGIDGLRLRPVACAGAAAARLSRATRAAAPSCCSSWSSSSSWRRWRRSWRAAGCGAGRWRGRSAAASRCRAWFIGACAAALVGAALYWITPFKAGQALAIGLHRRRLRHARRVRDEGAEARCRRAPLGQPRSASPARSACSTAWRRCVLRRRCSFIRCAGTSASDRRRQARRRSLDRTRLSNWRRGL